jgi:pyridoxine/pyridoxamine 5'-phosphate oxidase
VISNREELLDAYERLARDYEGRAVPRPAHWGGFRLIPDRIEFWLSRESRLHDRFVYARDAGAPGEWRIDRLAP